MDKKLCFKMDKELFDKIHYHKEISGKSVSRIIRDALYYYFQKIEGKED